MTISLLKTAVFAGALVLGGAAYADDHQTCEVNCGPPGHDDKVKGNNGWGNGPDTTNPGSWSGKTADSKSTNGYGFREPKFEGR